MPIKQLSSATFDASILARELENLSKAITSEMKTVENGVHPAGAWVFRDASHIRLVLQYNISTDTRAGHFDVLIETPDAD